MAGLDILVDSDYEPVTLALAKSQCLIDTDVDDEYFESVVIPGAREFAEIITARSYKPRTFREYFDGFPGQHLPIPYNMVFDLPTHHQFKSIPRRKFELMRSPCASVLQVQYLDQNGDEQTLDPSLYYVADHSEPASIYRASEHVEWPIPMRRVDSVWVDFKAGYQDPAASDAADFEVLPVICLQAMLLMISHWYENRLPVVPGSVGELPFAVSDLLEKNRVYYQA